MQVEAEGAGRIVENRSREVCGVRYAVCDMRCVAYKHQCFPLEGELH